MSNSSKAQRKGNSKGGPDIFHERCADLLLCCWRQGNHSNYEDGAFAKYVTCKGDIQMKIPDNMSFEEAATLGAGIVTLGQGLYQSLGLPLPDDPAKEAIPVLIYGGSTATGSLAIQFAKLYVQRSLFFFHRLVLTVTFQTGSGLQVITTCSPRHTGLVRSLGAALVFDHNSPDCASDIRKATDNLLRFAFDTVATDDTAKLCSEAIGTQGGRYTSLNPMPSLPRHDVSNLNTMVFTAIRESFQIGDANVPAKPEDFAFAVKFTRLA